MNTKGHLTIRARNDKRWVLAALEKAANREQRSVSFMALDILERHFSRKERRYKASKNR